MFDLTTVCRGQRVPDNRVMDAEQSHARIVSQGLICRADDIGEENGPDCGVSLVARTTREDYGSRRTRFSSAEKRLYKLGLDLDKSFCRSALCFTVD